MPATSLGGGAVPTGAVTPEGAGSTVSSGPPRLESDSSDAPPDQRTQERDSASDSSSARSTLSVPSGLKALLSKAGPPPEPDRIVEDQETINLRLRAERARLQAEAHAALLALIDAAGTPEHHKDHTKTGTHGGVLGALIFTLALLAAHACVRGDCSGRPGSRAPIGIAPAAPKEVRL